MKLRILLLSIIMVILSSLSVPFVFAKDEKDGKVEFSHYLIESNTGEVISSYKENERHQIASMVKIMTLNIVFEEIEKGNLSLDDEILVSKKASSQGGSELLLDHDTKYKVSDLIKGVIVVSANDATYALAEKIANNEDNFVKLMNVKALELHMDNTHFVNATGLPKDGQYSCAKDVTIMMNKLIKHKDYFKFSKIWHEDFTHPSGRITDMTNTNKLVRFYEGCDGGKTGFTNNAGFCISATAERNNLRLIGTLIGADSSKHRFNRVSTMFNDAFNSYEYKVIKSKDELIENNIKIRHSKIKHIDLCLEKDITILQNKLNKKGVNLKYNLPSEISAPIKKGDVIGTLDVNIDGNKPFKVNIIAKNDIKKSSIFDEFMDLAHI